MASVAQAGLSSSEVVDATAGGASSQPSGVVVDGSTSGPSVSLHVPVEAAPVHLHNGLRELARCHIRAGRLKFCEKEGHGWMGAGGEKDPASGKGKKGDWWWNVS